MRASTRLPNGKTLYLQPISIVRYRYVPFKGYEGYTVREWFAVVREGGVERERKVVWVSPLYATHRRQNYSYCQLRGIIDRGAVVTLWKLPREDGMVRDDGYGRAEPRTAGAKKMLEVTLDAKGEVVSTKDMTETDK